MSLETEDQRAIETIETQCLVRVIWKDPDFKTERQVHSRTLLRELT
jgi:hypothetical protein